MNELYTNTICGAGGDIPDWLFYALCALPLLKAGISKKAWILSSSKSNLFPAGFAHRVSGIFFGIYLDLIPPAVLFYERRELKKIPDTPI